MGTNKKDLGKMSGRCGRQARKYYCVGGSREVSEKGRHTSQVAGRKCIANDNDERRGEVSFMFIVSRLENSQAFQTPLEASRQPQT